jgi:hypothetical protein
MEKVNSEKKGGRGESPEPLSSRRRRAVMLGEARGGDWRAA